MTSGIMESLMPREGLNPKQKERAAKLERILRHKSLADFYPDFGAYWNDEENVLQALELYCQDLWLESRRCYINGEYRASIAMAAFTLETALKYRLVNQTKKISDGHQTLKTLLGYCRRDKVGILPHELDHYLNRSANYILAARDDIAHANYPIKRPTKVIFPKGPEHRTINFGSIKFIEEYRRLAERTLFKTKRIVDFLIKKKSASTNVP